MNAGLKGIFCAPVSFSGFQPGLSCGIGRGASGVGFYSQAAKNVLDQLSGLDRTIKNGPADATKLPYACLVSGTSDGASLEPDPGRRIYFQA